MKSPGVAFAHSGYEWRTTRARGSGDDLPPDEVLYLDPEKASDPFFLLFFLLFSNCL